MLFSRQPPPNEILVDTVIDDLLLEVNLHHANICYYTEKQYANSCPGKYDHNRFPSSSKFITSSIKTVR